MTTTIPRNSLFILTSILADDDGELLGGHEEFRIRDILDLHAGDAIHSSPGTWDEANNVMARLQAQKAAPGRVITKSYDGSLPRYTVNAEITREEALTIQREDGYHPAGYGFYGFKAENGVTTWCRGNNCD